MLKKILFGGGNLVLFYPTKLEFVYKMTHTLREKLRMSKRRCVKYILRFPIFLSGSAKEWNLIDFLSLTQNDYMTTNSPLIFLNKHSRGDARLYCQWVPIDNLYSVTKPLDQYMTPSNVKEVLTPVEELVLTLSPKRETRI